MSQWLSKLYCKSAHYFLVRQQQLQLKVWPKYRSQVSPFYNFFNYQHPSLPPSIPPSRSYYKMSLTKKIGIFFQKSKKVKIKKSRKKKSLVTFFSEADWRQFQLEVKCAESLEQKRWIRVVNMVKENFKRKEPIVPISPVWNLTFFRSLRNKK